MELGNTELKNVSPEAKLRLAIYGNKFYPTKFLKHRRKLGN